MEIYSWFFSENSRLQSNMCIVISIHVQVGRIYNKKKRRAKRRPEGDRQREVCGAV